MADPLQRAVAGTPVRLSASAWNRMLDAAKRFEEGGGVGGGVAAPHCLVRVRNDTGGDLSAFAVLKLGASILDVTVPMRSLPAPMFAGTTPAAITDAFAVLIEPALEDKFALAAISGVVPVEVNVTDAGHGFATPTAGSSARLTSATSGPARILDKEAGTGNLAALVLLAPAAATLDIADVTETIGPFVSGVTVDSVVCNPDGTITVTLGVTTKTQTITVTSGVLNVTDPA